MRLRSVLALLVGAAGLAFVLARRRGRLATDRVELYYEDGSSVAFEADTPEGTRLLVLAGAVRGAAA